MATPYTQSKRNPTIRRAEIKHHGFFATALGALLLFVAMAAPALAEDAVWGSGSPTPPPFNGDWNRGDNWEGGIAPVNAGDTATFNTSTITSLSLSDPFTTIDSMTFNAVASAFTFDNFGSSTFSFVGAGIVNNSTQAQNIQNDGTVNFFFSSTADNVTITNENGGVTNFLNSSTADTATIMNINGGSGGGVTNFRNTSTAANANITNSGEGTVTNFFDTSRAGDATIQNDSLGTTNFNDTSHADSAMIENFDGGTTNFNDTSHADNAMIQNFGGGTTNFLNNSTADHATIDNFDGTANFLNNSTAGNATIANIDNGQTFFEDSAKAGNATIFNGFGGVTSFSNNSTAGDATIQNGEDDSNSGSGNGVTNFLDASSAGNAAITNDGGRFFSGEGGSTTFQGTSNAGDAMITNNGGQETDALGGSTTFQGTSNAGTATIINNAGAPPGPTPGGSPAGGGSTTFQGTANAASATITNNGGTDTGALGGSTTFQNTSNAGNATLIANGGSGGGFGGTILFEDESTGGTARVEVFGNGKLDISPHTAPGVTIGSIEGDGDVFLGANNLTVGSNNLSTLFSGVIQDGVLVGGTGGSLTKVGIGTLTLSGTNTYTGLTTVSAGILNIQNGSALGATTMGTTVSSGATLQLQGGISVGAEALTISGVGAAGQNGALVNVSGTNNYGGLLTLGAASTISSDAGTLNLTNTGTITGAGFGLTLTGSGIGTISSIIGTGTGTVTKNGSGEWTLSGVNTYTGATMVNGGTLRAGVANTLSSQTALSVATGATFDLNNFFQSIGSLAGAGSVTLGAATLTTGNNNTSTNFSGVISGQGGLTKVGTGTQTLTGKNTYTGATMVDAGTLLVDGSLAAASAVTVNSGATLGGTGTAAGAVTIADGGILAPGHSPGTLTVGSLSLGNASLLNYDLRTPGVTGSGANDLTIVNGNLTLDGILNTTALAGFGPGAYPLISYGGALTDNTLNIGTVPAGFMASNFTIITGLPNEVVLLVLAGPPPASVQFWDGPNTEGNGMIDGGTGQWDNFRTNWTDASGNINSSWLNGTAVFAGTAGNVTVTQPIFFAGLEFMTDGYQINQGVRGSLNLIGSPTVTTESGVTATINATLAGAGGITKEGVGTLILNGANTYLGTTAIDAGSLIVDGSIASAQTFVNADGLLGGNGVLGGSLTNSGIVSPGHSPGLVGTLTVNGNYTQNANGTLRIEVAGTAPGQFDLLAVGGHASLAGTLQLIRLGNFQLQVGDKLTFLTAQGGVSGTFSTIQNPFVSNTLIKAEINILGTAVQLEGTQGSFTSVACNPNTLAVAKALDSAAGDPRAAGLIGFLDTQPLAELCPDLELISPEELAAMFNIGVSLANIQSVNLQRRMEDIRAGSSGFSATGLTINTRERDFNMGLAGPTGPEGKSGPSVMQPTPQNRWGVFVTGLGEFTSVDDTSTAPGYNFSTGGLTFGVDYRVSPNFAIGLTGGYADTNADLVNNGSLDVNGGTIGAYATGFAGGFYVDGAAFGTFNGYDSHRTALLGTASGDTDGQDFNALAVAGYDWKSGGLSIGPLASFNYTYVEFDSFTEHGSLAPLSFNNQNAESTRTALGAKASYDWHAGHVLIRPEIRASWQHEFGDRDYSVVSRFANGAGNSFSVNGPAIGRDSLLIGAGAAVIFNDRVSVYAYYDGELARTNYSSNNVSAGLRFTF